MYEKHNWVNGEVITEDKLNHLEDGVATGGGIYTYGELTLFDGEVTTVKQLESSPSAIANITLQGELPKSDISVTFNGQDYTLPYGYSEKLDNYWGEVVNNTPSFTNCPVFIGLSNSTYMVLTSEAGTYSLKINEKVQKFEVNDSFASAIVNAGMLVVNVTELGLETDEYVLDKKIDEIYNAWENNYNLIFKRDGSLFHIHNLEYYSENEFSLTLFTITPGYNPIKINAFIFDHVTEDGYPTNAGDSSNE